MTILVINSSVNSGLAFTAVRYIIIGSLVAMGCTGISIRNLTSNTQSVNTQGDYKISAVIEPRGGVSGSSIRGYVVIGGQTYAMTNTSDRRWDYSYRSNICESEIKYTIGANYSQPNFFVARSPTLTSELSLIITRPLQTIWDADERLSGAQQISFLVDLRGTSASIQAASETTITIKNCQLGSVTIDSVLVLPVVPSATGGGPGDVSFFNVQSLPTMPATLACDQTFLFSLKFVTSIASRSAALLIAVSGAPDLVINLYGKAFL